MRIDSNQTAESLAEQRRVELEELLRELDRPLGRPCPGCRSPCPCARRSPSCDCSCSPSCADAPLRLSSDPERHPIEPGVLPLVYAFHRLRVVRPCWSCEGHLDQTRLKLPQLWFYAHAALYPELIGRYVAAQGRHLTTPWTVAICEHQPDPTATTFALLPVSAREDREALAHLQGDLRRLAEGMVPGIRQLAVDQLRRLAGRSPEPTLAGHPRRA